MLISGFDLLSLQRIRKTALILCGPYTCLQYGVCCVCGIPDLCRIWVGGCCFGILCPTIQDFVLLVADGCEAFDVFFFFYLKHFTIFSQIGKVFTAYFYLIRRFKQLLKLKAQFCQSNWPKLLQNSVLNSNKPSQPFTLVYCRYSELNLGSRYSSDPQ